MTQFVQYLIDGIGLGSVYALLALGVALIFGVMNLINLAHGELITAAAYGLVLSSSIATPIAIVGAIVVVIALALCMDRLAFRPVRGATPATLLVTSFAVSYFLQNLAVLLFGATPRSANVLPALAQSETIGSLSVSRLDIAEVVVTLLALASLGFFLQKTRWGVQMRAAAEDFGMARLNGVRADTVIALAFGISGALAGLAAIMVVAQSGTVTPTLGSGVVLFAFVATVVGGIGSLRGAVVAAFALGIISVELEAYLPLSLRYFRDAFVFGAVILILTTRPDGLLPSRFTSERVG